jgi:hypothetical protein
MRTFFMIVGFLFSLAFIVSLFVYVKIAVKHINYEVSTIRLKDLYWEAIKSFVFRSESKNSISQIVDVSVGIEL